MISDQTRQLFEDYVYMRREIDRLLAEDTTATDVVRGSSVEAPYTEHPIKVRGIDTQYAKWIEERVETLRGKCAEVEAAIALAPNSKMRLILMYRYQDGLDWDEVGRRMGKSGDTCRKEVNQYLNTL